MTVKRVDDVKSKYLISARIGNALTVIFYLNLLSALIATVVPERYEEAAIMIQVIFAVVSVVLSTVDDGCFWYEAERARRRNNIQNAFGVTLDEAVTCGYYNNDYEPSLEKYALNAFESIHHSRGIAKRMIPKSIIKSLLALLILFIGCRFISNGNVLLVIAQTTFSSFILVDTVMLALYITKLNALYNEFYSNLISAGVVNRNQKIVLLAATVEYEAIKAHYKIRLDSSIHEKCNGALSEEWQKLLHEIVTRASEIEK